MCDLTSLYCSVDDFWKTFKQEWDKNLIESGKTKKGPKASLSIPEMMTIVIMFQQSNFRTFKHFYINISLYYRKEFPQLVSYSRFVHLKKTLLIPLFAYLLNRKGSVTGISFIDATSIKVCHNKRISRNKVFKGFAKRGKTSLGWFYGFKLHLIVNENGEIISFLVTPGNIADVSVVEELAKGITGKLFGDKGYISSPLMKKLLKKSLHLITTIRSNMKNKFLNIRDKILLRKRSIIETINDQLKNISQVEHTRHRSVANFLINLLGAIAAYSHQEKKPSINFSENENCLALAL